jgi:hypothetical protein
MSHTDPLSPKASAGHSPNASNAAEAGHELDEVDVKALVTFTIGMFVVVGVVAALMWGVMGFFQRQAAKNDPVQSPLASPSVQMPASTVGNPVFGRAEGVQLLTSEPDVLLKNRESEAQALTTYGWADEKNRVVRIPVAEAMKLVVERGLPARSQPADPSLGTRRGAYGESTGGRLITSKPASEAARPEETKQEAAPAAQEKGHQ